MSFRTMDLSTVQPWGRRAGRAALYLLFGSFFLAPAGVSAGMLLAFLAFPFAVSDWRELARQPVVLAALACSAYLLVLTATLSLYPPPGSVLRWEEASEWLQLLAFIPVAQLLSNNRQDLNRLLLFCLVGLALRVMLRTDWNLLLNSPIEHFNLREGYGFPALPFALYCGTALLGLVLLRDRCWSWPPRRVEDLGVLLLWLLGVLALTEMFFATQARGAWLSFIVTIGAGAVLARRSRDPGSTRGAGRLALATAAVAGTAMLTMTPQGEVMIHRIVFEWHFVEAMLNGEEINVAQSSIALRWNAQVFGIQTWLDRPLTGWGPGPSQQLMAASGNPNVIIDTGEVLKHLHNTYVEALVQTGILGLALAGLLIASLMQGLVRARDTGSVPRDLFIFLALALVFLLLWSLFDYRALHQDWRSFWALLAGTILSFSLPPADRRTSTEP